ncbi:MAG: hypothetical protein HY889_05645 [Deltaproteobacteria bacterium]|nr:hypothetical protein [Deltaproteobacteria bacterium]
MVAPKITKEEVKRKLDMKEDFLLLDVRDPVDYGKSGIKIVGGLRIPLDELEKRLGELDPKKEVVAYCT